MEEEKIINAIRKMVANDANTNYYGISGAEIYDWLESKSSNKHSALQFAIAYLINNGYNRTAKCLEKYFDYAPDLSDAERKQLYSDGFDTARKALAGTFMQYIDEHRPEGKMCLSNGECAQLDNAFKVGDVETIVRYIKKYQQPAEWSEEDEGMINCIISTLCEESHGGRETNDKMVTWLEKKFKSLRPQPKLEKVERNVFDRIADIIRWCYLPPECPIEDFNQDESERENMLYILQCIAYRYANSCAICKEYSRGYQDGLAIGNGAHWKPSEEQMKALENVIKCELSAGLHTRARILQTLQNDLKSYKS